MFPPGLGRRAEKIMKMLAWDAHKLSRQVMYFEDILNYSNNSYGCSREYQLSPISFEAGVSRLSFSSA